MIPVDILAMEMREIYLARAGMGNSVPVDAEVPAQVQARGQPGVSDLPQRERGPGARAVLLHTVSWPSGSRATTGESMAFMLATEDNWSSTMPRKDNPSPRSDTRCMLRAYHYKESAEDMSTQAMAAVKQACDVSMSKQVSGGERRQHVYWWNTNIAEARKTCFKARRAYQRALRRNRESGQLLRLIFAEKRKLLQALIKQIKLFPAQSYPERQVTSQRNSSHEFMPISTEEIIASAMTMKTSRAPGPDCIPGFACSSTGTLSTGTQTSPKPSTNGGKRLRESPHLPTRKSSPKRQRGTKLRESSKQLELPACGQEENTPAGTFSHGAPPAAKSSYSGSKLDPRRGRKNHHASHGLMPSSFSHRAS
ncbi:hypothetical protein ACLKA7_001782 [Drosophila subpalustris]